ncbi:hypothetical protein GCM10020229_35140 [Kitasatospora albolonga]
MHNSSAPGSELSTLEVGECYGLITDQDGKNTSGKRRATCSHEWVFQS